MANYLKGNDAVGDTPIFDFHDYGRKSRVLSLGDVDGWNGLLEGINQEALKLKAHFWVEQNKKVLREH